MSTAPKPIWSELAERQTVSTTPINARVSIRTRQIDPSTTTKDVMVDGYAYTSAVSDAWLDHSLPVILGIVEGKPDQRHFGHGQWEGV